MSRLVSANVRAQAAALLRRYRAGFVALVLIHVASTALQLYFPMVSQQLIDSMLLDPMLLFTWGIGGLLCLLSVVQIVTTIAKRWTSGWLGHSLDADLRLTTTTWLLRRPHQTDDRLSTGDTLQRIHSETRTLRSLLVGSIPSLVTGLIVSVGAFVLMWRLHPVLTLLLCISGPLVGYLANHAAERIKALRKQTQESFARAAQTLKHIVDDSDAIRLYGMEAHYADVYAADSGAVRGLGMRSLRINASMSSVVGTLQQATYAGAFCLGALALDAGELTWGELSAFLMYASMLQGRMRGLIGTWTGLKTQSAVLARLDRLLQPPAPAPQQAPLGGGALILDDFGALLAGGEPRIQLSAALRPGQPQLLTGPSGSGKSTLCRAIAGLSRTQGALRLGGEALHDKPLAQRRDWVTLVPQTPPIFRGTLRDNLDPRGVHEDAWLLAELERFGLLDRARELGGLDGEHLDPATLSGGERQRIAVLRGLLRATPVLVVDEPTAWLDDTSSAVCRSALTSCTGRIVLIATHDPGFEITGDRIRLEGA